MRPPLAGPGATSASERTHADIMMSRTDVLIASLKHRTDALRSENWGQRSERGHVGAQRPFGSLARSSGTDGASTSTPTQPASSVNRAAMETEAATSLFAADAEVMQTYTQIDDLSLVRRQSRL